MDLIEKYIGEGKPVYTHTGDDKLVSLRQKGYLKAKDKSKDKDTVKWKCPNCGKEDWDYKGKAKEGKNRHKCRHCGQKVMM